MGSRSGEVRVQFFFVTESATCALRGRARSEEHLRPGAVGTGMFHGGRSGGGESASRHGWVCIRARVFPVRVLISDLIFPEYKNEFQNQPRHAAKYKTAMARGARS